MALIGEVPRGTLVGKMCKWNSDFRVSKNEMTIEVGESEERLNVFDFPGFWPILDDLDLVRGHCEPFGRQHVSEVFAGSEVELAFVCTSKQSISAEPTKYFLNVSFVFGNVVRIDENVIQIYDDNHVDHICEDVIHKSLKSCWSISKPFRHYQPFKGTVTGPQGSLPFVSGCNLNEMVCVPEVDFGVDSCISLGASKRSEM